MIVVDALDDDPGVRALAEGSLPIVVSEDLDQDLLRAGMRVVTPDHRAAMDSLLDHLAGQGMESLAFIAPGADSSWGRATSRAITDWCTRNRMRFTTHDVGFIAAPNEVTRVVAELVGGSGRPDAIVSGPDGAALTVLETLRGAGLRVGSDILLAGAVDSSPFQFTQPTVTAIDHKPKELGNACAGLLLDALVAPEARRGLTSESPALELIVRESSSRIRR